MRGAVTAPMKGQACGTEGARNAIMAGTARVCVVEAAGIESLSGRSTTGSSSARKAIARGVLTRRSVKWQVVAVDSGQLFARAFKGKRDSAPRGQSRDLHNQVRQHGLDMAARADDDACHLVQGCPDMRCMASFEASAEIADSDATAPTSSQGANDAIFRAPRALRRGEASLKCYNPND